MPHSPYIFTVGWHMPISKSFTFCEGIWTPV